MMVKVCGITRREDALAAAEAGASAIGFIFYPKSPRYVMPEKARELGDGLNVWKVGVFVDESTEQIEQVMRAANLDVAQIYGGVTRDLTVTPRDAALRRDREVARNDEPLRRDREVARNDEPLRRDREVARPARLWQAVRVPASGVFTIAGGGSEALFLDSSANGVSFDWNVVRKLSEHQKIIIAGGLNPSNVADAIRIARPWGVDASSGLESSPGIKDHEKVRQFVRAARERET